MIANGHPVGKERICAIFRTVGNEADGNCASDDFRCRLEELIEVIFFDPFTEKPMGNFHQQIFVFKGNVAEGAKPCVYNLIRQLLFQLTEYAFPEFQKAPPLRCSGGKKIEFRVIIIPSGENVTNRLINTCG